MAALPDFTGEIAFEYAPHPDGRADPGEIVWTWVPFEDDPSRGKDRPVLVVGRDGRDLLGLMLTSKDHDRDAADESRSGRHWVDIGAGAWDRQGRPSEIRVDRVLRIDPDAVRREGATLDPTRFEVVVDAVRAVRGQHPSASSTPSLARRIVRRLKAVRSDRLRTGAGEPLQRSRRRRTRPGGR